MAHNHLLKFEPLFERRHPKQDAVAEARENIEKVLLVLTATINRLIAVLEDRGLPPISQEDDLSDEGWIPFNHSDA